MALISKSSSPSTNPLVTLPKVTIIIIIIIINFLAVIVLLRYFPIKNNKWFTQEIEWHLVSPRNFDCFHYTRRVIYLAYS